jgi:mono/diheme cytochrome c family protein
MNPRTWLRTTRYLAVPLAIASCYVLFAQVSDAPDRLHNGHLADFAKVPEKARTRLNPLQADRDAPLSGQKLFAQHCAQCHGARAEGGRKAPSLHVQDVQTATPGTLFWILTNGVVRRGMPAWSKLPEPQRWQIVTFLQSMSTTAGNSHAEHSKLGSPMEH